jgi:hypothetical protein
MTSLDGVPMALYLQVKHPIRQGMEFAQYAERRGFHSVWQAESRLVREATIPMAAYAAATERITVGSGVVNNWTRNPAFLASTSVDTPTMPTDYTVKRRIGSFRTNSSAEVVDFDQYGDRFLWKTPVLDFDATNPGTSAILRTLTVPTGVKVHPLIHIALEGNTSGVPTALITSPDQNDTTPSASMYTQYFRGNEVSAKHSLIPVMTNTSAQIRTRLSSSEAANRIKGNTFGWIDSRGKE